MENKVEAIIETPTRLEKRVTTEHKTPLTPTEQIGQAIQSSPNSGMELKKTTTPDRLKVPTAFKYPERYRSPTDSMMSPVTKGLLARVKKGSALFPPSINQFKIQDLRVQDVGLRQEINN